MPITLERQSNRILFRGDTYPLKDKIRAAGGHWDADSKVWWIGATKASAAEAIAAETHTPAALAKSVTPDEPGACKRCGKPCKAPFVMCYACKMHGKCLNCGTELGRWEKQHGVKRCADCRGGNAHGGMSYRDRNGNFVLGDDD